MADFEDKIPFRVIRGSEEKILNKPKSDGYLYFSTDTGKIFLDTNEENKKPLCESKGFYYGKKGIKYENNGQTPEPTVYFTFSLDETISEVEGDKCPEIGDLILNIGTNELKDGCFYRVIALVPVDDIISITTTRLTLQGTGGGSGSGEESTNFSLSIIGNSRKIFSSEADSMPIQFRCNYNGTSENSIAQVAFKFSLNEDAFYISNNSSFKFNQVNTIDLIAYKNLFTTNRRSLYIEVTDQWNTVRSVSFSIQLLTLLLTKTEGDILTCLPDSLDNNTLEYNYEIAGTADDIKTKQVIFNYYKEDNLLSPYNTFTQTLDSTDEGSRLFKMSLNSFEQGVYYLEVQAKVELKSSTEIIYSNTLTHKAGCLKADNEQPLLVVKVPEKAEMYTNIPVEYYLLTTETNKRYTLQIKINGQEEAQLQIGTNVLGIYNFYFEEKIDTKYTLLFVVTELNLEYQEILNVSTYTGNIPIIDPTRDDLMLYLNARKHSNDALDKELWKDYSGRIGTDGNTISGKLSNFGFNKVSGWAQEEDGSDYLLFASGASMVIDNFNPFSEDYSNKNGLTIELDFSLSDIIDYEDDLISCLSIDDQSDKKFMGFRITGDRIYFYNHRLNGLNDTSIMSLNITENQRIRVSFVIEPKKASDDNWYPMCYTYLNGILSNAVLYLKTDNFSNGTIPAQFKVNSTNGKIKLYNVRFYQMALSHREILNNYTASFSDIIEKEQKYNTNNVFNVSTGKVDLNKLENDYNLQIPYMKIVGGWPTQSKQKWTLQTDSSQKPGLPTGKKDFKLIDVYVRYPDNDYFKNYHKKDENYYSYVFKNEFASGHKMSEAFGETPSNGGCIMYAQGTSSLEYPVKNLRLRFKKKENYFKVRPNLAPSEIICMKADYMDSSGSHNTGGGNFVDDVYADTNMLTPGQIAFQTEDNRIVTCIKGHPCLIFYSENEEGPFEYIGKYNLNLDKATPEHFGFESDDKTGIGYLKVGDSYYKEPYNNDGDYLGTDKNSATFTEVTDKNSVNSVFCFEFLDNAVPVCNFEKASGKNTFEETWYDSVVNADNEKVPGWALGFESRYPEDKVGYHDADCLYEVASWINELYEKYMEYSVKDYQYTKAISYNYTDMYYTKQEDGSYIIADPKPQNEDEFKLKDYYLCSIIWKPREEILEKDSNGKFKNTALNRFAAEYECYFNKEFLLTYYLITDALLMVDSRVKNMMIATWGKEEREYINENGEKIKTNNFIWYPIFYDMDTMLGIDNSGFYRFDYYSEDYDATLFNGDEALWVLVRDSLENELKQQYTTLENGKLKANSILPYFNQNQADIANEAFYNGDADYKYIEPARNGYFDNLYNKRIEPGAGPYLKAAQGSRSLMRDWFIKNRMRFLQGKYNSGQFQNGDRIEFRMFYPTGETASDLAVQPSGIFDFTSLKVGYGGVKVGGNGNVYSTRFNTPNETQQIIIPTAEISGANGTELYLLGVSNLKDLGDLSDKYPQKIIISSTSDDNNKVENHLSRLTLGNSTKGYKNPWLTTDVSLTACTSLEYLNFENCSDYKNTLNISNSNAIKTVLAIGSGITGISLPTNGILQELRLPSTISELSIDNHLLLNDSGFTMGTYEFDGTEEDNKIGYNKSHYKNDFSNLTSLKIINTPINTYDMVIQASGLTQYCLQNINWDITNNDTEYIRIYKNEFDKNNEQNIQYYFYINGQYEKYTGNEYPTDNSILYRKFTILDENNNIICIPAIEKLSRLTTLDNTLKAEALTGNIIINISNSKVNELTLYNKYHELYPNLNISYGNSVEVEAAKRIYFYRTDKDSMNGISIDDLVPYYTALTDGTKTLQQIVSSSAFTYPTKASTSAYIYNFTNTWIDWKDSNKKEYKINDIDPITQDVYLIPIFTVEDRKYKIDFYDEEYPNVKDPLFSIEGKYNETIYDAIQKTEYVTNLYFNYKEIDNLNSDERYAFKGWLKDTDLNTSNIINPKSFQITGNLKFIAYYEKENCVLVASNSEYFNINNKTINLKEEYKYALQGKITLPLYNGSTQLTTIGDFAAKSSGKQIKITDIYFLSGNSGYTTIRDDAFNASGGSSMISNIDFPGTITKIGNNAFDHNTNLINVGSLCGENCNLEEIGRAAFTYATKINLNLDNAKNLKSLGGSSEFNQAGSGVILKNGLPKAITSIGPFCFSGCPNVVIQDFSNIKSIGSVGSTYTCLDGAGTGSGLINIILPDDLSGYAQNCFKNYAKNCIRSITYANSSPVDDEQLAYLGLIQSNPQSIDYVIE